jgi:predicted RNA-binding protein with PIN domain
MRWFVDGMNVIGCRPDGWWRNRRLAMTKLVEQLELWAAAQGADVTVVFEHPLSLESSVITVTHAPRAEANAADDEIVRMVAADERPEDIRVATSDRTLADRVRAAGASVYPAETLRNLIDPR